MNKTSSKLFAIVFATVMILAVLPQISVRPTQGAPPVGPPLPLTPPFLCLSDPSNASSDIFYTNTTGVGSNFTITAWVSTTYDESGWSGALFFNSTQLNVVSVALTANASSQSAWFYDQGIYAPDTGSPPFTDWVIPPTFDNVGGTIGEPGGFGETDVGNSSVLGPSVDTLFTITFEIMMVPSAGQYLTGEVDWDTFVSEIYTPQGVSDPNVSYGNFLYTLIGTAAPVLVNCSCSPNNVSVGSPVTCTAALNGSGPTGTISWTTSSSTGIFSPAVCTLSSGTCSTTYTDNNTGFETITATYSGDSNYLPSNGNTTLTVYVDVATGTNVTVTPTDDLELTFDNVTTAGTVVANATPTVQAPNLDLVGQYYVISVTASFSGNVTVGIAFDGSGMTVEQKENLTMNLYTPIIGDIVAPFGIVDMRDVAYEVRHFGTNSTSPNWDPICDLNGDGVVNMKDIALLVRHFGFTATWVNITIYVDTTNNIIYGNTTHFSFIGIH